MAFFLWFHPPQGDKQKLSVVLTETNISQISIFNFILNHSIITSSGSCGLCSAPRASQWENCIVRLSAFIVAALFEAHKETCQQPPLRSVSAVSVKGCRKKKQKSKRAGWVLIGCPLLALMVLDGKDVGSQVRKCLK